MAIYITVNGERDTITGWSKKLGLTATNAASIHRRGRLVEKIEKYLSDPDGYENQGVGVNITVDGETHNIKEWGRILNISAAYAYTLNQKDRLIEYIEGYKKDPENFKKTLKMRRTGDIEPGTVIGRLTVKETIPEKDKYGGKVARCVCECGTECIIPYARLRAQNPTKSCGCLQKDAIREALTKDLTGMTFGKLKVVRRVGMRGHFVCWEVAAPNGRTAIVRGTDLVNGKFTGENSLLKVENVPDNRLGRIFKTYFRKNREFDTWEEFEAWALENGYTDETTCRRFDANKPYVKDNVYFKKKGSAVTINGETKNLTEWANILGISRERVRQLNSQGRLEDYVLSGGAPHKPGRPRKLENNTYNAPPAERNCKKDRARKAILEALDEPKTLDELFDISEFSQKEYFISVVIAPLLAENLIEGRITGVRNDDDTITIEKHFYKVAA